MDGSREAAEFSHVPRVGRWGASRPESPTLQFSSLVWGYPLSRFSSRKASEEGEKECLAAPSLRGQSLFGVLWEGWEKVRREGRGAGTSG